MRHWRLLVALLAVFVWGLSAPLAMASDHCLSMGAVCEGPCGASSCVASDARGFAYIRLVTPAVCPATDSQAQAAPPVAEPPPKPLL
jgi:hypothetical protein